MRMKSGLTLRLTLYSAEVQRTFRLTYVLFMVVIQCPFPPFEDGLGNSVQSWRPVTSAPKSGRSISAGSPMIVKKIKF